MGSYRAWHPRLQNNSQEPKQHHSLHARARNVSLPRFRRRRRHRVFQWPGSSLPEDLEVVPVAIRLFDLSSRPQCSPKSQGRLESSRQWCDQWNTALAFVSRTALPTVSSVQTEGWVWEGQLCCGEALAVPAEPLTRCPLAPWAVWGGSDRTPLPAAGFGADRGECWWSWRVGCQPAWHFLHRWVQPDALGTQVWCGLSCEHQGVVVCCPGCPGLCPVQPSRGSLLVLKGWP